MIKIKMSGEIMKSIEDLRREIDKCDKQIISNFEKRLDLVLKISEIKQNIAMDILDINREKKIIKTNIANLSNPCFNEEVEKLTACILSISKEMQAKKLLDKDFNKIINDPVNNEGKYEEVLINKINLKNNIKQTDNIILIGFMGTGKSAVGNMLSKMLGMSFIDIDKEIEKNEGMSIERIFYYHSQEYFRSLEKKYIEKIINIKNTVISCGGGAVLDEQNSRVLEKSGLILLLEADTDIILARVKDDTSRPLIKNNMNAEFIETLQKQRKSIYKNIMNISIDTSYKNLDEICKHIIININRKKKTQLLFNKLLEKPSLCISIISSDFLELNKDIKKIKILEPDMIEFRADYFMNSNYNDIKIALSTIKESLANLPLIFTFRNKYEGGKSSINETERMQIIKKIIRNFDIDILDIEIINQSEELKCIIDECKRKKIFVIGSYHNFYDIPGNEFLKEIFKKAIDSGCNTVKIAVMSDDITKTVKFIKTVDDISHKNNDFYSIPIAMGKEGMISRVIFEKTNLGITYTSIIYDDGKNYNIGQLDFNTLKMLIDIKD